MTEPIEGTSRRGLPEKEITFQHTEDNPPYTDRAHCIRCDWYSRWTSAVIAADMGAQHDCFRWEDRP